MEFKFFIDVLHVGGILPLFKDGTLIKLYLDKSMMRCSDGR